MSKKLGFLRFSLVLGILLGLTFDSAVIGLRLFQTPRYANMTDEYAYQQADRWYQKALELCWSLGGNYYWGQGGCLGVREGETFVYPPRPDDWINPIENPWYIPAEFVGAGAIVAAIVLLIMVPMVPIVILEYLAALERRLKMTSA